MAESITNLRNETDIQIQEVQDEHKRNYTKTWYSKNGKREIKDSESSKKKTELITREPSTKLLVDFYTETPQAKREWQDKFKVLKGKHLQPRIL